MPKRTPSRASPSLRRDMVLALSQRGRASQRSGARVWVRAHEADGHLVRGHWRDNPATGGTLLKDDLEPHIQRQLSEHAAGVSRAAAEQHAASVRAELQQYAQSVVERVLARHT